jgi:hypothetical protein
MNLAENQDNTYSIANCLAAKWQADINNGVELPDLYIIHIAIGAQGVYGMWSPRRAKKLIPGKLGDVDAVDAAHFQIFDIVLAHGDDLLRKLGAGFVGKGAKLILIH